MADGLTEAWLLLGPLGLLGASGLARVSPLAPVPKVENRPSIALECPILGLGERPALPFQGKVSALGWGGQPAGQSLLGITQAPGNTAGLWPGHGVGTEVKVPPSGCPEKITKISFPGDGGGRMNQEPNFQVPRQGF